MRKLLLISLSAAVGSAVTVLVLLPPSVASGGAAQSCVAKNGDVNADGTVDLSDAVTILGHLFLGSPTELVPLCAAPAAPPSLPDTGQTKCYDQAGAEIACDGATCPGQDGFYSTGCASEGRFVDNGDGTVSDNCTRLMWQKDTADTNGDGQSNQQDGLPWCDALAYCDNLSFAGHNDWRLPNIRELQSIVDYGRASPSIDPVFGALDTWYWSSTWNAVPPYVAWGVSFSHGFVLSDDIGHLYVRAVRGAP